MRKLSEKVAKSNFEIFLYESVKLYSEFNNEENNTSTIYNLLSNNLEKFVRNWSEIVQEGDFFPMNENLKKDLLDEGYTPYDIRKRFGFNYENRKKDYFVFEPMITEAITDNFLIKLSNKFVKMFSKIEIWSNLNFQLNKLFNYTLLDKDFNKILEGEINHKDLDLDETAFKDLIKSISIIKKDIYYQQLIESSNIIAFDKKSKYKGKDVTVKEKKQIFHDIFDIKNYYKAGNSFKIEEISHSDEILATKGDNNSYIGDLIEDEIFKFSKDEIDISNIISSNKEILSAGNNFDLNVVYYFNKIYDKIIDKIDKNEINFITASNLFDNLGSDLMYSGDLFQLEKMAFSYESKIDSILDSNYIVFTESDKKALFEFESSYISKFNDIEEEDLKEFRNTIEEILQGIKQRGKFYITDYSRDDKFVYFAISKLFSNHYNTTENNSILEMANSIDIISSKIDFEMLQTTIEEILFSTKYQRDKLTELNSYRKDKILSEFDSNSNKKFLNYTIVSLKSIVENTFEKLGTLNFFRLHKEINDSINSSKEKTLFGVFKDVLVNYLANKYNLLDEKDNNQYTLLLSFDNYLSEDMLNIIKKLSLAVNKNIVVGKNEIVEVRNQTIRGFSLEEKPLVKVYKFYLTKETPVIDNKYTIDIIDSNLNEEYEIEYNEDVLTINKDIEKKVVEQNMIEISLTD